MSKFGFHSDRAEAISFESHLSGLEENAKALLLDLRDFVLLILHNTFTLNTTR